MGKCDWLAQEFEANRKRLQAAAYRMLGSVAEAEDVVQEAWLRLSCSEADGVENLGGWLTTVVARISLDRLRARKSRREEPLEEQATAMRVAETGDPEHDVLLADSVGPALLVVLDMLAPAERGAFVLHDMFGVPFEDIGALREPAGVMVRGTGLHPLLAAPFRYAPYPKGSRFRRANQREGAFYAAESVITAVAEMAFYRFLFLFRLVVRLRRRHHAEGLCGVPRQRERERRRPEDRTRRFP